MPSYGEKHPCARLTAADVREIRRLHHEEGQSTRSLAKRYGVAQSTMWDVCNYVTWRAIR